MLAVQLQAVATLTTEVTPTSSLRFVNQTPADLSATLRAPATLTLSMRQWNGVVPPHRHAIADLDGGLTGQVVKKNSDTNGDVVWGDPPESLPPGGTTDQILAKASDADGDAHWVDKPTSGVWGEITGTLSDQTDLATALASARAFAIAVS